MQHEIRVMCPLALQHPFHLPRNNLLRNGIYLQRAAGHFTNPHMEMEGCPFLFLFIFFEREQVVDKTWPQLHIKNS